MANRNDRGSRFLVRLHADYFAWQSGHDFDLAISPNAARAHMSRKSFRAWRTARLRCAQEQPKKFRTLKGLRVVDQVLAFAEWRGVSAGFDIEEARALHIKHCRKALTPRDNRGEFQGVSFCIKALLECSQVAHRGVDRIQPGPEGIRAAATPGPAAKATKRHQGNVPAMNAISRLERLLANEPNAASFL